MMTSNASRPVTSSGCGRAKKPDGKPTAYADYK
jgi:hypothetical protein